MTRERHSSELSAPGSEMIWQSCAGSLTQNHWRGTKIWEQSPLNLSHHLGGCRAGTAGAWEAGRLPSVPSALSASQIFNTAQGSSC